jgi:hypothetical protein
MACLSRGRHNSREGGEAAHCPSLVTTEQLFLLRLVRPARLFSSSTRGVTVLQAERGERRQLLSQSSTPYLHYHTAYANTRSHRITQFVSTLTLPIPTQPHVHRNNVPPPAASLEQHCSHCRLPLHLRRLDEEI